MKDILILSGGAYNLKFCSEYLKDKDFSYVICADRGLDAADSLGIKPDLIMGDFDSVNKGVLSKYKKNGAKILSFPSEKDESDSELSFMEAVKLKPRSVTVLGATGKRMDHLLCNINTLNIFLEAGIKAYMVDEYSILSLIKGEEKLYKNKLFGRYISFIPFTDVVRNVTLTGFKYNVSSFDMYRATSRGLSNEMMEEEACISFDEGIMMMLISRD
ncbi:MAG: thiamine diphosphokinase [Lachnospiraceae bacterium]|nr:thiamine diphosphokinase [Lachnospiraceae bacterium]